MKVARKTKVAVGSLLVGSWLLTLGVHVSNTTQVFQNRESRQIFDEDEFRLVLTIGSEVKNLGIPFLFTYSYNPRPFTFSIYARTDDEDDQGHRGGEGRFRTGR